MADRTLTYSKQRLKPITVRLVRSALKYNPKTGSLKWRHRSDMPNSWNAKHVGQEAGWTCQKKKYISVRLNGLLLRAHRLIWLYMTGKWPPYDIDHKNNVRGDNRWKNLRSATKTQNSWNSKISRRNTSGFKGVTWRKDIEVWSAHIGINGTQTQLGFFPTAKRAHAAYKAAANKRSGEFANHG